MKFRLLFITLLLGGILTAATAAEISKRDVEQTLSLLDNELSHRSDYLTLRQHYIDSLRRYLKRMPAHSPKAAELMLSIGASYTAFNNDSALIFLEMANRHADEARLDSLARVIKLRRAMLMPLAGLFTQAEETFNSVDTTKMDRAEAMNYYSTGRQMYSYIASFFENYPDQYKKATQLSNDFQNKLVALGDDGSDLYRLNLGESYYINGEYDKAAAILTELLADLRDNDNNYARAAHMLSSIARSHGDINGQTFYLARSAIADIKSATLEVTSLQQLGMLLFENDDIGRAHDYLSVALQNAVNCHAAMRVIETSTAMPLIINAHNIETEEHNRLMTGILIVLLVMLAGMVFLVYFLRREMHHMHTLQLRLSSANKVKDVYLTQFLNLCSIYIDKLNNFSSVVQRKISAGKVDDLSKLIKSGKFVEEQSREFYDVFDDAFLHIYPTFLQDVNTLLRPD